jgi:hypothetical protein
MGGLEASSVTHGGGWRLLSCMWLHGGVFHVLVNMLGVLVVGIRLEKDFGPGQTHALIPGALSLQRYQSLPCLGLGCSHPHPAYPSWKDGERERLVSAFLFVVGQIPIRRKGEKGKEKGAGTPCRF